jgi:hypothetical protein
MQFLQNLLDGERGTASVRDQLDQEMEVLREGQQLQLITAEVCPVFGQLIGEQGVLDLLADVDVHRFHCDAQRIIWWDNDLRGEHVATVTQQQQYCCDAATLHVGASYQSGHNGEKHGRDSVGQHQSCTRPMCGRT